MSGSELPPKPQPESSWENEGVSTLGNNINAMLHSMEGDPRVSETMKAILADAKEFIGISGHKIRADKPIAQMQSSQDPRADEIRAQYQTGKKRDVFLAAIRIRELAIELTREDNTVRRLLDED